MALSRSRKILLRLLLFFLVAPPVLIALYTWAALSFSYSKGERVGYVQKFSNKGWICKTWEGELAMVNLPGAMPEIFKFTVRDEGVVAKINEGLGHRVTLHYEQHLGLPSSCFGDTSYFVTNVRQLSP
ncbi:MAG TPA: hypothetical protein VGR38_13085 [Candidatus Polarisedimenticolia bacterium]|nr:hypothetical protein [Candidatus Polarisedimenticolia bacterium]